MCHHVSFLPCGIAGYFPTLTTYEWTVLSVEIESRCMYINASGKTLITQVSTLTGNSKQPQCRDLWTKLPIYQLVISTLLSLILSGKHHLQMTHPCAGQELSSAMRHFYTEPLIEHELL